MISQMPLAHSKILCTSHDSVHRADFAACIYDFCSWNVGQNAQTVTTM